LRVDSEGGGEVYMVENEEELSDKMVEEIQWEADEEVAHTSCFAREGEREKWHNDLQDDSGASDDEPRDGAPMRRHHPKFNSQRLADRD
jgi:hypothetical protein